MTLSNEELKVTLNQVQNFLVSAGELINKLQVSLGASASTSQAATQQVAPQGSSSTDSSAVQAVAAAIRDFSGRVNVSVIADGVVSVKPVKYLGAEEFGKLASALKPLGGRYVSAGRDSHFEVKVAPKK